MLKYVETLTLCFSHFLSCVSYRFLFHVQSSSVLRLGGGKNVFSAFQGVPRTTIGQNLTPRWAVDPIRPRPAPVDP